MPMIAIPAQAGIGVTEVKQGTFKSVSESAPLRKAQLLKYKEY
jgi:hypothetical protein